MCQKELIGNIKITPPLSFKEIEYINNFASVRHDLNDNNKLYSIFKTSNFNYFDFTVPVRASECITHNTQISTVIQDKPDIKNPQDIKNKTLPEINPCDCDKCLNCDWVSSGSGNYLMWSGNRDFPDDHFWLQFLIDNFLKPDALAKKKYPNIFSFLSGHNLNGDVEVIDLETSEIKMMKIRNNLITSVDILG